MTEFRAHVEAHLRLESLSAPERGLRRTLQPFLKQLASRFDDIESIDKVAAVQGKVRLVNNSTLTPHKKWLVHAVALLLLAGRPTQGVATKGAGSGNRTRESARRSRSEVYIS